MLYTTFYNSPVGILEINSNETHINCIKFIDSPKNPSTSIETNADASEVINLCIDQLNEYFKGSRRIFNLPVYQEGTLFQQQVWSKLVKIPYGKTISYSELAIILGDKNKIRAVAGANRMNKIAIIVPCHRVIGKDGKLVGYAGGLWRKKYLLNLEFGNSPSEFRLF